MPAPENIYGLMAEFEDEDQLLEATKRTRRSGYRKIEAYSPFPVEGLSEAVGMRHTFLSMVILGGGVLGAIVGFSMQYYAMVISLPINSGGKPLNSWPAFIPVTFELTILFAGFTAVLGMLALNSLPEPYHPVFNVPSFEQASRDRFFLVVEAEDDQFDLQGTRKFLEQLKPLDVFDVPY